MRYVVMGKQERAGHAGKGAPRVVSLTLAAHIDGPVGEVTVLVDLPTWDAVALGDLVDMLVVPAPSPAKLRAVPSEAT